MPVVPVAIHGSEHVREAKRLRLPKVTVQYGEPLHFGQVDHPTKEQSQEVADQVFDRVRNDVRGAFEAGTARRARAPARGAPPGRSRYELSSARSSRTTSAGASSMRRWVMRITR